MNNPVAKITPTPVVLDLDAINLLAKKQRGVSRYKTLARHVYGVFGIPIDAAESGDIRREVELATENRSTLLISTPNLNYLIRSQVDKEFREALLLSDLCPADGMPIVWLSSLLGIPIKKRYSGSDIFDDLKSRESLSPYLKVFLFGGPEGSAANLCSLLNSSPGMRCVGSIYPGFGSIEEMSNRQIIDAINSSEADLLAVFLTASKGQAWLLRNHSQLSIPIRVQLGATINFQTDSISRAPKSMQKLGMEWIWRIKEEPYLWKRYWSDGLHFLRLVFTQALVITFIQFKNRLSRKREIPLQFVATDDVLRLVGAATAKFVRKAISEFEHHLKRHKNFIMDVSELSEIDARFFGLLLMLRKQLHDEGGTLIIRGVSTKIRTLFRLNGFEFLLAPDTSEIIVPLAKRAFNPQ